MPAAGPSFQSVTVLHGEVRPFVVGRGAGPGRIRATRPLPTRTRRPVPSEAGLLSLPSPAQASWYRRWGLSFHWPFALKREAN